MQRRNVAAAVAAADAAAAVAAAEAAVEPLGLAPTVPAQTTTPLHPVPHPQLARLRALHAVPASVTRYGGSISRMTTNPVILSV